MSVIVFIYGKLWPSAIISAVAALLPDDYQMLRLLVVIDYSGLFGLLYVRAPRRALTCLVAAFAHLFGACASTFFDNREKENQVGATPHHEPKRRASYTAFSGSGHILGGQSQAVESFHI